ncbi:hypothetical protein ADIARSV_1925 [Arcticibacter svalbardensis MN12-7]|uniref:Uncharacterized protein n=1 Tax=Arcticibacter svalbardensis MN12-7 TaxID=1150600 RepID=R9GT48_9SPHI|nr:hypothetical protein ADIARSV_1925 [Arcticibacter svalbardensis MN12-7]
MVAALIWIDKSKQVIAINIFVICGLFMLKMPINDYVSAIALNIIPEKMTFGPSLPAFQLL